MKIAFTCYLMYQYIQYINFLQFNSHCNIYIIWFENACCNILKPDEKKVEQIQPILISTLKLYLLNQFSRPNVNSFVCNSLRSSTNKLLPIIDRSIKIIT